MGMEQDETRRTIPPKEAPGKACTSAFVEVRIWILEKREFMLFR